MIAAGTTGLILFCNIKVIEVAILFKFDFTHICGAGKPAGIGAIGGGYLQT